MMGRAWTAADDQFLIETHSTLMIAQQAERLGRSYFAVSQRRRKLRDAGRLTTPRAVSREWTASEDEQLAHYIQDGYSVLWIAKRMGRSDWAIDNRVLVLGGMQHLRSQVLQVRTLAAVARLFGVSQAIALGWVQRGWLKARKNATAGRTRARYRQRLVCDADILTFMEHRDGWAFWKPEQLTDPDWQDEGRRIRAGQGDWLTLHEVGARFGYSGRTVTHGSSPLWRQELKPVKIGRRTYVWSENLIGFVPPQERERAA